MPQPLPAPKMWGFFGGDGGKKQPPSPPRQPAGRADPAALLERASNALQALRGAAGDGGDAFPRLNECTRLGEAVGARAGRGGGAIGGAARSSAQPGSRARQGCRCPLWQGWTAPTCSALFVLKPAVQQLEIEVSRMPGEERMIWTM